MSASFIKKNLLVGVCAATIFSTSVFAAESLFAFTLGVDTLPKGQSEIALGMAALGGKRSGSFTAVTFSGAYERGVGDNLSLTAGLGGFYINSDDNAFGMAPDASGAPAPIIPAFSEERLSRVEIGVQRRILSPYTDYFGFAVRTDATFEWFEDDSANTKAKQYGIRPTLIFQKNFLDDTLNLGAVVSANFRHGCQKSAAPTIGPDICRNEVEFRPSLGAAYRFAPKWNIGAETFYRKKYTENGDSPGSLFIGPTIHYGDKRWYATASMFWQAAGSSIYAPPMSLQYANNLTRLANETEFRFRVGVNL